MDDKYGFSPDLWDKAKDEMREIMIEHAKIEDLITYTQLVDALTTIRLEPHAYALFRMLWEIASEEDEAGRGILTAIVVLKDGNSPGSGFFDAAQTLGRDISDELKCWQEEVKRVHDYWSTIKAS